MKRALPSAVAILLASVTSPTAILLGQSTVDAAIIRGTVISGTESTRVAGVSVGLLETRQSVLTGLDGSFTFDTVAPGVYHLEAKKLGYSQWSTVVRVAKDTALELVIQLIPHPQQLTPVEVRASPSQPEAHLSAIRQRVDRSHGALFTAAEIHQLNPLDTRSLLERLPGVHVTDRSLEFVRCSESATTLSPYTSAPTANVQVYVDGVRVTGGGSEGNADAALRSIHPLSIDAMEVYTGLSRIPAEYLADACAVIVIWTKRE
jgi:hypothetical protein